MKTDKLINLLKNGGIKIAIIHSLFLLAITSITFVLALLNFKVSYSDGFELIALILIFLAGFIFFCAGLYGSSNDMIAGNKIGIIAYLCNGKKYFERTLKYFLLYALIFGLIAFIPLTPYLSTLSNIEYTDYSSFLGIASIIRTIILFIFQTFCTPLIILKVLKKDTKGYFEKNFSTLLLFSFIVSLLSLIPTLGIVFFALLSGIYPLLVLSIYIPQNLDAEDKVHTNIG